MNVAKVLAAALVGSIGLVGGMPPAAASPAWSLVASPNPPGPPAAEPFDVACTSATACFTVGRSQGAQRRLFAERWDGTARRAVPIQTPTGFTGTGQSGLSDLSCSGSSNCFAVGFTGDAPKSPLMERWNGTSWSIVTAPKPAGATDAWLTGVSCRTAVFCMATGNHVPATTTVPFAARWDGTSWSVVTMPSPAGGDTVHVGRLSCTSSANCFAVGQSSGNTLIERWNGTSWSIVPSPTPQGTPAELEDISCPTSASCFAVGEHDISIGSGAFAVRWNGASWSLQTTPVPSGTYYAGFLGVSCASSTSCFAVGFYSGTGDGKSLIDRWDGTSWTTVASPSIGDGGLRGVSCVSATACFATGISVLPHSSDPLTFAVRWNGTAWGFAGPVAGGSQSQLEQVACPSSTTCFAVGSYLNGVGTTKTLIERWDGTSWTIVPSPSSAWRITSVLSGISCASETSCFAVGRYEVGYGARTLIEQWDGTSWSIVASPNAAGGAYSSLSGVSCPSSTRCIAVGGTLVEEWNGTAWAVSSGAAGSGFLSSVSCPTVSSCIAVGSSSSSATFVRSWNGTSWSTVPSPNPVGAYSTFLVSVSCTTSSDCAAVGYAFSNGGVSALVERWNGTTWSIETTPNPAGSTTLLYGVDCASATSCFAVGTQSGGPGTLVEEWNGSTWAIVPSPNRAGTNFDQLKGVSCVSATSCVAVGSAQSSLYRFTLIERYA